MGAPSDTERIEKREAMQRMLRLNPIECVFSNNNVLSQKPVACHRCGHEAYLVPMGEAEEAIYLMDGKSKTMARILVSDTLTGNTYLCWERHITDPGMYKTKEEATQ